MKIKRVFLLIMTIALLVLCSAFGASAAKEGYYTYKIKDGEATITNVDETISGDVVTPDKLGGYPVVKIGNGAFDHCSELNSVIISEGVRTIGEAFGGCNNLEYVKIADSVTKCNTWAFNSKIKKLEMGSGLTYIPSGIISNCPEILIIGDGVKTIGELSFAGRDNLKEVVIGNNVTIIGNQAFDNCINLEKITWGKNLKTVGWVAFSGCPLTSVTLPDSVETVNNSFWDCPKLKSIKIGKKVSYFQMSDTGYEKLEKITVSKDNKNFASDKYGVLYSKDMTNLLFYPVGSKEKTYKIPAKVKTITSLSGKNLTRLTVDSSNKYFYADKNGVLFNKSGTKLFYPCSNKAKSLVIPNTVTELPVFLYCNNLEKITIGKNVSGYVGNKFLECKNLKMIVVASGNKNYSSDKYGVLYNKNKTALYVCPSNIQVKSYVIPNSVTEVEDFAFENCCNIEKLTIGSGITYLMGHHFYKMERLKQFNVTSNNKAFSIDKYGVLFDKKQTSLISYPAANSRKIYAIPNDVESTERNAFTYCKNLKTLIVPDSIKGESLYDLTYRNYGSIEKFYCYGSASDAFTRGEAKVYRKYKLGAPSKVTAVPFETTVTLAWNEVISATGYIVYKVDKNTNNCAEIANVKKTEYTITGLKNSGNYTFMIKAYNEGKKVYLSDEYKKVSVTTKPIVVSNVAATSTSGTIEITWSKVAGATGYRIYRYNTAKKKWVTVASKVKGTKYTVKKLKAGTQYIFSIKPYKTVNGKDFWAQSGTRITTATKPATVTLSSVTAGSKQATLNWKTVAGATGYEIQYSTNSNFKSAEKATVTKQATKKKTIKKLTKGKKYYFKVRAYKTVNGKKIYGGWSAVKNVKIK